MNILNGQAFSSQSLRVNELQNADSTVYQIVSLQAAGSSLLAKLTNLLVLDALKIAGMADISTATVLPLATGMALTSVLLALKRCRPPSARYVIWPR